MNIKYWPANPEADLKNLIMKKKIKKEALVTTARTVLEAFSLKGCFCNNESHQAHKNREHAVNYSGCCTDHLVFLKHFFSATGEGHHIFILETTSIQEEGGGAVGTRRGGTCCRRIPGMVSPVTAGPGHPGRAGSLL